jgi:hypothetical protein
VRERFYVQPDEWVDAAEPVRPQTMGDLTRALGVADATQGVRAAAIREWLATNTPTPMMRFCLVEDGYLDDVPDRA